MSKVIKTASLIVFLLAIGLILSQKTNAATYTPNITSVDSIEEITAVKVYEGAVNPLDQKTVFQFTLTKPAYILVSVTPNINDPWGGRFLTTNLTKNGKKLNGRNITYDLFGKTRDSYYLLSPGIYQYTMTRTANNSSSGSVSCFVCAQYLKVTNRKNTTKSKAFSAVSKKEYHDYFTEDRHIQWYKFKVKYKTKYQIKARIYGEITDRIPINSDKSFAVFLYNSKSKLIKGINGGASGETKTLTASVKKGTYYVKVTNSQKSEWDGPRVMNGSNGENFVKVIAHAGDKTAPKKPKVTFCRSGRKIVRGKGEAYSIAYVVYKGKTYHARVAGNKRWAIRIKDSLIANTKVKVYLKDDAGNKSKNKNYKVKRRRIPNCRLIICRKGRKYIKGYTTKTHEKIKLKIGSETFIAYSNDAKYFKLKVNFKIKKKHKMYIKVVDKYKNCSKYKRIQAR